VDDRRAAARAGPADDTLRKVTQLEEMVARTHERAAELYERWLEQHGDPAEQLRSRASRHWELAAEVRSVQRLAARSLRGLEMRIAGPAAGAGKARSLAVLTGLEHLRRLVDQRIEELVAVGRQEGASWTEIAAALRVTRQTAHERYRNRSPSGTPDEEVRPTGRPEYGR
jgi:hypothetical protein